MPFSAQEVVIGMIAYFAIDELRGAADIRFVGGSPDAKSRPFVCYAQDAAGDFYWTPLTTDNGQSKRAVIKKKWIERAPGKFRTATVIVNDGGHTYAGSAEAFAKLSSAHDKFQAASRPSLNADGVAVVLTTVQSRNGLQPTKEEEP